MKSTLLQSKSFFTLNFFLTFSYSAWTDSVFRWLENFSPCLPPVIPSQTYPHKHSPHSQREERCFHSDRGVQRWRNRESSSEAAKTLANLQSRALQLWRRAKHWQRGWVWFEIQEEEGQAHSRAWVQRGDDSARVQSEEVSIFFWKMIWITGSFIHYHINEIRLLLCQISLSCLFLWQGFSGHKGDSGFYSFWSEDQWYNFEVRVSKFIFLSPASRKLLMISAPNCTLGIMLAYRCFALGDWFCSSVIYNDETVFTCRRGQPITSPWKVS